MEQYAAGDARSVLPEYVAEQRAPDVFVCCAECSLRRIAACRADKRAVRGGVASCAVLLVNGYDVVRQIDRNSVRACV